MPYRPPMDFSQYSTRNPLSVLAQGIAGIGYDVGEQDRLRRAREAEEARYNQQRQDMLDRRTYLQGRDELADQRYADEVAYGRGRDERSDMLSERDRAFDLSAQGFKAKEVPGRTETGIATPRGYIGRKPEPEGPQGFAVDPTSYDPTRDVGVRRDQAFGDADLARQKELAGYQSGLRQQEVAAKAAMGGGPQAARPTEVQARMALQAPSALSGLSEMQRIIEEKGTPNEIGQGIAGRLGLNRMADADTQRFFSAAQVAGMAIARAESGAGTPESELRRYAKAFTPMPGDKPEQIQYKLTELHRKAENIGRLAGPALDPETAQAFVDFQGYQPPSEGVVSAHPAQGQAPDLQSFIADAKRRGLTKEQARAEWEGMNR